LPALRRWPSLCCLSSPNQLAPISTSGLFGRARFVRSWVDCWCNRCVPRRTRLASRGSTGRDAGIGIVDIVRVETNPEDQAHWRIKLAERPPRAAGLDPANTLISYGLVFETTGDGIGDYIVGINNDAPKRGDFRVWVTDVASGRTEEQIGPPYGFPIEFSHPDEVQGQQPGAPIGLLFTFLSGSAPAGLTGSSPFYAWSSVTAGDEVIAWDYAPDASWLLPQEVGG